MSKSRANPPLPDRTLETAARHLGYKSLAGVDEAGRGPLAGPVVAAACVIPEGVQIPHINDSKKIHPDRREALFDVLATHSEVAFGAGVVSPEDIDRVNILQATILAMRQAVDNLIDQPDYLLIDGLHIPEHPIPNEKVIGGDSRCYLIAAASIIAKVTRDRLMEEYHKQWPEYGFHQHKGYATRQHREAIAKYGPSPIHRMSFEPLKSSALRNHSFQKKFTD